MSNRKMLHMLVILIMVFSICSIINPVMAETPARIMLLPRGINVWDGENFIVKNGDCFYLDIIVQDAVNLYGIELHVIYDHEKLTIMDEGFENSVESILTGDFLNGDDGSSVFYNSTYGLNKVCYASSYLGEGISFSGTGVLATIPFKVIRQVEEEKPVYLAFDDIKLVGYYMETLDSDACSPIIMIDNKPPRVISAEALNNTSITVVFNEKIDGQAAACENNYAITHGLDIMYAELKPSGLEVRIDTEEQVGGEEYMLTVSNIADIVGNIIRHGENQSGFIGAGKVYMGITGEIYQGDEFYLDLMLGPTKRFSSIKARLNYDYQRLTYLGKAYPDEYDGQFGEMIKGPSDDIPNGILGIKDKYFGGLEYLEGPIKRFKFTAMDPGNVYFHIEDVEFRVLNSIGSEELISYSTYDIQMNILPLISIQGNIIIPGISRDGAEVVLRSENGDIIEFGTTNELGQFSFGSLKKGHFLIDILKEGYLDSRTEITLEYEDYSGGFQLTPGDLNSDNVIDIIDCVLMGMAFNSKEGDENWNSAADYDGNGLIDIFDVVILTKNYGKRSALDD